MMITPECAAFDAVFVDYLEHTLDPETAATAEAHRASCARCDALARDLDQIRAEAGQLQPFAPSRDLWPGIAASIGTPVRSLRPTRSRTWMAAASIAAALVVTAGTTYVVTRMTAKSSIPTQQVATNPVAPAPAPTPTTTTTPSPVAPSTPASVTPVAHKQTAEATYAQEIAGLHAIVEQRSTQLDPHTRAVIEHNLKVIDNAISESRRALANDPHSAFLADQLDQALDTKLQLLRTVALLPART
jgi:hypothetical protein